MIKAPNHSSNHSMSIFKKISTRWQNKNEAGALIVRTEGRGNCSLGATGSASKFKYPIAIVR